MNEIIKLLIDDCIDEFNGYCKTDKIHIIKYGTPPSRLIIYQVEYYNMGKTERLCKRISAWNYSDGMLTEIPTDTEADTEHISGMYFSEAYAKVTYDGNGTAFYTIYMGRRFARCYRYNCVSANDKYELKDKKIMWVS